MPYIFRDYILAFILFFGLGDTPTFVLFTPEEFTTMMANEGPEKPGPQDWWLNVSSKGGHEDNPSPQILGQAECTLKWKNPCCQYIIHYKKLPRFVKWPGTWCLRKHIQRSIKVLLRYVSRFEIVLEVEAPVSSMFSILPSLWVLRRQCLFTVLSELDLFRVWRCCTCARESNDRWHADVFASVVKKTAADILLIGYKWHCWQSSSIFCCWWRSKREQLCIWAFFSCWQEVVSWIFVPSLKFEPTGVDSICLCNLCSSLHYYFHVWLWGTINSMNGRMNWCCFRLQNTWAEFAICEATVVQCISSHQKEDKKYQKFPWWFEEWQHICSTIQTGSEDNRVSGMRRIMLCLSCRREWFSYLREKK